MEKLNENRFLLVQESLVREVKSAYNSWCILQEKYILLQKMDSVYTDFRDAVSKQFELGDINQLNMVFSRSEALQVKSRLIELEAELIVARQNLLQLLGVNEEIVPAQQQMKLTVPLLFIDSIPDTSNLMTRYISQMTEVQRSQLSRQKNSYFPDFFVGYFNQSLNKTKGFDGFQLGARIPIWFWSNSGKVQASRIDVAKIENTLYFEKMNLMKELNKQLEALEGYRESLSYYESGGLSEVDQLISNLELSYQTGDINYFEYVRNTGLAFDIKLKYLETLEKYNSTIIEIEFLIAQ
jgi:cobalt-zinc-cadmium resistance protein CzcA